jgi:hypothetical protein
MRLSEKQIIEGAVVTAASVSVMIWAGFWYGIATFVVGSITGAILLGKKRIGTSDSNDKTHI